MEFDENDELDKQQEGSVEIYSRNAVLWFSILADPLIGGILLIINLWVVGYKRAIAPVVVFLLVFEGFEIYGEYWYINNYKLSSAVQKINDLNINDLVYLVAGKGLQIIGGLILSQYFYKRSFPENDYYPRSILQPMMITAFILLAMQYYGFSF